MFGEIKPILIDTDVIINHLRGMEEDTFFLRRVMVEEEFKGFFSVITEIELFAAEKIDDRQAEEISKILENLYRVELNSPIAKLAGKLLGSYRKSNGLEMPDAVIASSALYHGMPLATKNARHYSFIPGLLLIPPEAYLP